MTKLVPILALTALATFAPTNKAEAFCGWGGGFRCGWGWWRPAVVVGVPLTVAATRPYYYGYGPYYGRPYYYSRGYGYSASADVQAALAHKGYYRGSIDGVIGPQSREAIRSYQARHNLPVTGSIDRPLLRSLRLG